MPTLHSWKLWNPQDTSFVLVEGSEHLARRLAGLIAGEGQPVTVEDPAGHERRVTPA
jgi:hypothetical protein